MIEVLNLPIEIQEIIWDKASKAAAFERDIVLNEKNDFNDSDEMLYRRADKSQKYCLYMRNMAQHDLGIRKKKPWPHYLPVCRRCSVCGHLRIPLEEPSWKKRCKECWQHETMPWVYGFR